MMAALKTNPDWFNAAQSLVSGCLALDTREQRVQLLQQIADQLGDELYPAFLQILCLIGENGTREAQALITDTLVHSLITGRLPSGNLSAWGSSSPTQDKTFGQTRSLGPIEYLCSWYTQPSGRNPISTQAFTKSASSLLRLVSADDKARLLYCDKLLADVNDPMGGSLSSQTRVAVTRLVETWKAGATEQRVIDSYLRSLHGNSLDRLSGLSNSFTGKL